MRDLVAARLEHLRAQERDAAAKWHAVLGAIAETERLLKVLDEPEEPEKPKLREVKEA